MTKEEKPKKVLIVDDDDMMRKLFVRFAEIANLEDVEVFEDASSAVERLQELEQSEVVASIISDGLHGGWKDVITAAKKAKVPAVVLSGDSRLRTEVEETGTPFYTKDKFSLDFFETTLATLGQTDTHNTK